MATNSPLEPTLFTRHFEIPMFRVNVTDSWCLSKMADHGVPLPIMPWVNKRPHVLQHLSVSISGLLGYGTKSVDLDRTRSRGLLNGSCPPHKETLNHHRRFDYQSEEHTSWRKKYLTCECDHVTSWNRGGSKSNINKRSSQVGVEPTIFWSVVRRVIHCATGPPD